MKALALAAVVMFGAAAAAQEPVYKPGDKDLKNPEVVKEVRPSYTAAAMRAKIQGAVELGTIIDAEGKPTEITVKRSLDKEHGLDDKAIEALREWRFKPATVKGKPVRVQVSIEMTFALRRDR